MAVVSRLGITAAEHHGYGRPAQRRLAVWQTVAPRLTQRGFSALRAGMEPIDSMTEAGEMRASKHVG